MKTNNEELVAERLKASLEHAMGQPNTRATRANVKATLRNQIKEMVRDGLLPEGTEVELSDVAEPGAPTAIGVKLVPPRAIPKASKADIEDLRRIMETFEDGYGELFSERHGLGGENSQFKVGDVVKYMGCPSKQLALTILKNYVVLSVSRHKIKLAADNGKRHSYLTRWFKLIYRPGVTGVPTFEDELNSL